MTTEATPGSNLNPPPHWTLTAAALVAFLALALNGASVLLLALLAVALGATHLSAARLPDDWWLGWLLRLAALGLVLATDTGQTNTGIDWLLPAGPMRWFGQMCAAELTLQRWRRHPSLGKGGVGGILLSALVLLAASNTLDGTYFRYLTPVWIAFTALALPYLRPEGERSASITGTPQARRALVVALGLALLLGTGFQLFFATYLRGIDSWALSMLSGPIPNRSSGFGATPTLGESYDLQDSPQRVLRLEVPEAGLREVYLRGMAYNNYDRGRWLPALQERPFRAAPYIRLRADARGPRVRAQRLVNQFALLFLPLHAAGLRPPEGGELEWTTDELLTVRSSVPALGRDSYEWIEPPNDDFQGPLCRPLSGLRPLACLEVPDTIHPNVRKLALSLARPGEDAEAKIQAVEKYLMSHHQYSLRIRPGQGDPISTFLLQRKSGHCQFFAASTVMLLRCLDVPARYVQGYYAHEGAGKGRMIVRSRDAHAWVEAWVPKKGWVTVDATPGGGRPDALAGGIPPWLNMWERLQDALEAVGAWISDRRGWLAAVAAGGLTLLMLTMLVWNLTRRRASVLAPVVGYSSLPAPELAALAGRFEWVLERLGLEVSSNQPWSERVVEGAGVPRLAQEVLEMYNGVRFGPAAETPARLEEECRKLDQLLTELESEVGKTSPSTATDNGTDGS